MKNKITKTLTLGISCLMLTLTISIGVVNHNSTSLNHHVVHIDIEMPNA